jgi:pimeloyl-ACP methyl ester carboxylesterase
VPVKDAKIETLSWGPRGAPGLLLLHGHGAHADWWSFIAPYFADRFRVTALSWSGMGGSDWRPVYSLITYSEEIFAVAHACGLFDHARRPIVAAHSFGSLPLMLAAKERGAELGGAVIIDCYYKPDRKWKVRSSVDRRLPYRTLEEALARFRLQPNQSCEHLFIADYIARHSLKYVDAEENGASGWTWRFDPALLVQALAATLTSDLSQMICPVALISGERSSLMTPSHLAYMTSVAPSGTPNIVIPDADHHVLLDQPLALVAAIGSLLTVWPAGPTRP